MKAGARILAIDDAPFNRQKNTETLLVGLLFRGMVLERAEKEVVTVDGNDAHLVIRQLFSKTGKEARLIMLHGTTVAGFNVIDVLGLNSSTGVPVAAFLKSRPGKTKVLEALRKLGFEEKIRLLQSNPPYERFSTEKGPVYCSYLGVSAEEIACLLNKCSMESKLPEQLRMADLVASLF